MDTTPHSISDTEWAELLCCKALRDALPFEPELTTAEARSFLYGVKFNFVSGSPGYVGDLFIVQGDHLTGVPPMTFFRRDGVLEAVRYDDTSSLQR